MADLTKPLVQLPSGASDVFNKKLIDAMSQQSAGNKNAIDKLKDVIDDYGSSSIGEFITKSLPGVELE